MGDLHMATIKLHSEVILRHLLTTSGIPALANLVDQASREVVASFEAGSRGILLATPLAAAYRYYWSLPESEPLIAFEAVRDEITALERKADARETWQTLLEAATAYHAETGRCPFCRERGPLHLPAEQPELELSGGVE